MKRTLTATQEVIMDVLASMDKATIHDFMDAGLERGRELHQTLREMEAEGLLTSRLPTRDTPLRLYEMRF